MNKLKQAALDLLEGVEAAIKAGDWKIDGACDPELAIYRLREALDHPGEANEMVQEPVADNFVGIVTSESVDGVVKWKGWIPREGTKLYTHPVQQAEQEMVTCDWENQCNKLKASQKSLREHMKEIHNLRQQVAALKAVVDAWNNVEQEPVAIDWDKAHEVLCDVWNRVISADDGFDAIQDLIYAAPLRTKDLTDYEIVRLYDESSMCDSEMISFARAVIAAFKEKNNANNNT